MTTPIHPATAYTDRAAGRVDTPIDISSDQREFGPVTRPETLLGFAGAVSPERSGGHAEPSGASAGRPVPQQRRTSARQLTQIQDHFSPRDRQILDSLSLHPFLTTLQMERLHFTGHASADSGGRVCRRVLKRLAGLRVIEHLERRVGGVRAGSASFVWRLGPVGDRLLRQWPGELRRARRKQPSLHHLGHSLAVAEAHIRLVEAARCGQLELLELDTEPTCWRRYLAPSAARAVLKPDLSAVTSDAQGGQYEDHWFIEVDRGTESLPTLLRKCRQYEQYRRADSEQQQRGVFPLVLWLLPDSNRLARLDRALTADRSIDPSLFRLAEFAGLVEALTEPSS